jgi:hypothetical protein
MQTSLWDTPVFQARPDAPLHLATIDMLRRSMKVWFSFVCALFVLLTAMMYESKIVLGWFEPIGIVLYLCIGVAMAFAASKYARAETDLRMLETSAQYEWGDLIDALGIMPEASVTKNLKVLAIVAKQLLEIRQHELDQWTTQFKEFTWPGLPEHVHLRLLEMIREHRQLLERRVEEARKIFQRFGLIEP